MSTETPPTNTSSGVPNSLRHPPETFDAVLAACRDALDAAQSDVTYPNARRIADGTGIDARIVGHVLTACAKHRAGVIDLLDREPAVEVAIYQRNCSATRYALRRRERPIADGGQGQASSDPPAETTDLHVVLPVLMADALDDFVASGAYQSRSAAIRAAVRAELRRTDADPDALSQAVQTLYNFILTGKRPEAVAQCEQVAERLGVTLDREVLD